MCTVNSKNCIQKDSSSLLCSTREIAQLQQTRIYISHVHNHAHTCILLNSDQTLRYSLAWCMHTAFNLWLICTIANYLEMCSLVYLSQSKTSFLKLDLKTFSANNRVSNRRHNCEAKYDKIFVHVITNFLENV